MKSNKRPRTSSKGPYKKKPKKTIYDHYGTPQNHGPILKRNDVGGLQAFFDNTTTLAATIACAIPSGDGSNQRDGNHVRFKSIRCRMSVGCAPQISAVIPASQARFILFYDRAPNGVAPIWTDIVANSNSGTSTTGDPINFNNRDRFLILNDERFNLPGFGVVVAAGIPTYNADQQPPVATNECRARTWYHNFSWKLDSKFIGNGGTIASVGRGAFFVIGQGSIAAAGGTTPWFYAATVETTYSDSIK